LVNPKGKELGMPFRRPTLILFPAILLLCGALRVPAQQRGVNAITIDGLRTHLQVIANDETEGRDTPSTAINVVSRYLATMAENYGFNPLLPNGSYYQNIPLELTAVSESKSRMRVISGTREELFYCPQSFGGTFRASGAWSGDVVFVGYGLNAPDKGWDDYADLDLTGKSVMMLEGQLPENHPLRADRAILNTRSAAPRARGAALVLTVISPEREKEMATRGAGFTLVPRPAMLETYPTQNQARIGASPAQAKPQPAAAPNPQLTTSRPGAAAAPPGAAEIRHEVAASLLGITQSDLAAMFDSLAQGRQVPRMNVNKRVELSVITEKRMGSSPNVLAVLEGSDPVLKNEYVVLSAHHDHLGMRNGRALNGADDDGSGTVALLEIAKVLPQEKPKRSVILAWFTGEEKGLWGSHYFVNHCPVPLEKISANLNLDMISRNDPGSLFLIASNNLSTELDGSILAMNEKSARLKFDYVYNDRAHPDRFYYRSDQYPFIRMGIPGVWIFCGTTPDYHTLNDTIERVDFRKMEKVTRMIYLVTLDIGNKPALLKLDANKEVTVRGKANTAVESIR
jgi:Zn-dependent M28 family amino/carboxypeptidase